MKFGSKGIEGKIVSQETILIVLDPVINFYVLEGHKNTVNLFFVGDLAFMEVRI